MKIRARFVSNSSSSSFCCEVCGTVEGGWDCGLAEVGMTQCANGHIYCQSHAVKGVEKLYEPADIKAYMLSVLNTFPDDHWMIKYGTKEEIEELDPDENGYEIESYWIDFRAEIGGDVKACPICQFQSMSAEDAMKYLLRRESKTAQQQLAIWKAAFGTYEKFKEWLGES